MKTLRSVGMMAAVFVLAFSVSLFSFRAARGSDHQDSPTVVKNPLADITDVYAFPNPHDASRVVLAMDVRPLIPAGMTSGIALDPKRSLPVQGRHQRRYLELVPGRYGPSVHRRCGRNESADNALRAGDAQTKSERRIR